MTLLILGIAIWFAAHLFKRLAPGGRARLTARFGDGSKGIVAGVLVLSVVLMVIGYRSADSASLYTPIPGIGHLNNLLMVVAFLMFGAGSTGSWLASRMRHPMLTATKIWAVAHLLVNGDVASVVLFGSMLVWAVVEVIIINRTEPAWTPDRAKKPGARDLRLVIVWLVMIGVAAAIHIWLGYNPFQGTYG